MTSPTVSITDRNETKFLIALGFVGKPSPRNSTTLDFVFEASEELFKARRKFCCNHPVPILDHVEASKFVEAAIHSHRAGGVR